MNPEALYILFGFIAGMGVMGLYQYDQRERSVLKESIRSLQQQLKGKLPSYVTRDALEDIVATDMGTKHDRISLRLYLMEGLKRLDALEHAEEQRLRISKALRTGHYDPDKSVEE